jgi:assimilatory nitrate reductase catalytic subunit
MKPQLIASTNRVIKTTCPYCGVGCGVSATIKNHHLLSVAGDQLHPANFGKLCVKGSALHETMGDHGRLLQPSIEGVDVDWPTAISAVAEKLNTIRNQHGAGSIGFYLSGQLLTEDYYVANKLAKGFIGTSHVDTNSRLCMSSAVAGYKRAFGADAVPCNYEDLEQCDLLVLTGSNAAWTHPILYRRIADAKVKNPAMRVVVIDPRRTATCDLADLHLAIAPGADAFVFNGLLAYMQQGGHLNTDYIAQHTQGIDAAIAKAEALSPAELAQATALTTQELHTFYQWFCETEKTISFYSMGINQSATGTDKCNAIINCHLATGRIGKVGMGPFSMTGQPNAMGGREVGGLANMLAAHMDYNTENIATVSEFWQTDSLSQKPGLKAVDLFDAVADGHIKAIWIMGTNPVVSMPNADRVRAALQSCDTVIVSDCVAETDTTATANILLPASGWGEKSGTVTNSERRISRQRALVEPAGQAKPDWWIMSKVGQAMGFNDAFDYQSPRDIFIEHAQLSGFKNTGNRLFNISSLSHLSKQQYDQLEPIQWPVTPLKPKGTDRLFEDGLFVTPSGKANFVAVNAQLPQIQTSIDDYPLTLNTGRIRDQWHTMSRTARTSTLLSHIDQPFVAMHPDTATHAGLMDGDLVQVSTQSGSIKVVATVDAGMGENQIFVPIHWNDQYAGSARVSALVAPTTDTVSGQPEFKYSRAAMVKVDAPVWATVVSRQKLDCTQFINWSAAPIAEGHGFIYQIVVPSNFNWPDFIAAKRLTEQGPAQAYERFSDRCHDDERLISFSDQRIELAIFSHQDKKALPDSQWMRALVSQAVAQTYWPLLSGTTPTAGKLICSCFKVSEGDIRAAIVNGANSAAALGQQLKCGTNCGSCIPELNGLLAN